MRAILPVVDGPFGARGIFDPCAGDGALLRACGESWPVPPGGLEADAQRAQDARASGLAVETRDALESASWGLQGRAVVMNPPFSQAEAFVRRALVEARATAPDWCVAALLRLAWLEGLRRAPFHREHPANVHVLARRPSFTGGGTDSTAYAWFVWGPGPGGRWSILGGA